MHARIKRVRRLTLAVDAAADQQTWERDISKLARRKEETAYPPEWPGLRVLILVANLPTRRSLHCSFVANALE